MWEGKAIRVTLAVQFHVALVLDRVFGVHGGLSVCLMGLTYGTRLGPGARLAIETDSLDVFEQSLTFPDRAAQQGTSGKHDVAVWGVVTLKPRKLKRSGLQ